MGFNWDDLLTPTEREVMTAYERAFPRKLGNRPAVLVVDVNNAFVGAKSESVVESVDRYATSCGQAGWEAIPLIQEVLGVARNLGVPVIYTTSAVSGVRRSHWGSRTADLEQPWVLTAEEVETELFGSAIVAEIEPRPEDLVLAKLAASSFFGTPLASWMNHLDLDTLLVLGTSTSGCVRATVVDAAAYGYYVGVVGDACFDRFAISHRVSLMDMKKYGVVLEARQAVDYLGGGAVKPMFQGRTTSAAPSISGGVA